MPRPRVAEEQLQAPGHADQQQMDGNNKAAPPMPKKRMCSSGPSRLMPALKAKNQLYSWADRPNRVWNT